MQFSIRKHRCAVAAVVAITCMWLVGCSGKNGISPVVSVTGTACVYVEPDEVTVCCTLYSKDTGVVSTKQKNDELLKKFYSILKDFAIDKRHCALNRSTVHPEYQYDSSKNTRIIDGYSIRQEISVKMIDITKYDAFVAALLRSGIDRIDETFFSNSQLKQHREEARRQAVQAAIRKAQLLCASTAPQKKVRLGSVLEIKELSSFGGTLQREMVQNRVSMYQAKQSNGTVDALDFKYVPIGTIPVQANVEMVFALQ